jgi:hypothetical protein
MSDNYLSDNYITNNIFIRDNKLYYKIKKEIKITSNNWHKYLHEYGWYKLHLKWIKRLNEFRVDKKSKNSQFGVLDCGGSGDCFFSCVIESLNSEREVYDKYEVKDIREQVAKMITNDNFSIIIEHYKILVDINEFTDEWDPYSINGKEDLQKEIIKEGSNFLADHIIFQLFQELHNINIIILNSTTNEVAEEIKDNTSLFKLYNTGVRYSKNKKTIILSYDDEIHFRLIGYLYNNNMVTLFDNKTLPVEVKTLINNEIL